MDLAELAKRLGATTLFSQLPRPALGALLARCPRRQWPAGASLADGARHHIVLLEGRLQAQRHWTTAEGLPQSSTWDVGVEADGPGFSLLSAAASGIQVQAATAVDCLLIPSDELDELLGWSELGGHLALARHLKVFHQLPLEHVQQAFDRMSEREVRAGDTVVTQGEPGDSYYILLSGQAQVWVTDPISDETRMAAVLGDGDAFGEEALLVEGNRTATVTMLTPGRLLRLAKADFDDLLKPQMVHVIDPPTARDTLARGEAALIDCRYDMEFEESRIPGARLVPLTTLRQEGAFALDADTTYIVYCRSGRRSSAAAFLLRERGIRALSLRGGIKDWPFELDNCPL